MRSAAGRRYSSMAASGAAPTFSRRSRATAVLLGRTTRWALGAFGPAGAQRLLEMIQQELIDAAATAGRATLASIDASVVKSRFP